MANPASNRGLDELLVLNGAIMVVDPSGNHWVKFVTVKVTPSAQRPHGISYSLTMHGPKGERLVGYDNAHAISTGTGPARHSLLEHDHFHSGKITKPYVSKDAETLMQDFWNDVFDLLKSKGLSS